MTQKPPDRNDQWSMITTLFEEARTHYFEKTFDLAEKKYREVLEMQILAGPEEGTVRCELGYALFGKGDYDQAIVESQAALNLNPSIKKTYGVYNTLGSSFLLIHKYEDAIQAHLKAIDNSSNDEQKLRSSYQLGRSYLLNNTPQSALEMFQQCLELLPDDDQETQLDIHYNLGFTYASLDKRFNSEKSFRILLKEGLNPSDVARGYFGLMQLYIGMEDYEKVIEFGKRTLEEMPEFPERELVLQGLTTAASKLGKNKFADSWEGRS